MSCRRPQTPSPRPSYSARAAHRAPQVAPTGSDASICVHTDSAAAGSCWSSQPSCRRQFARKSDSDGTLKAAPSAGLRVGAAPARRACTPGEHHELCDFLGMLRGITARARPAERPADQAHPLDAAQLAQIFDDRIDVGPIGSDGRSVLRHWVRPSRASVARHIHREHVETGRREIRHPAALVVDAFDQAVDPTEAERFLERLFVAHAALLRTLAVFLEIDEPDPRSARVVRGKPSAPLGTVGRDERLHAWRSSGH